MSPRFADEFVAEMNAATQELPGCLGFGVIILLVVICAACFIVLVGAAVAAL